MAESPSERLCDVSAEQGVLGAMLLAPSAIAEVTEVLSGRDFYKPQHETIFQAIIAMYAANVPVDVITVAAHLSRQGDLGRIGGILYLHTLISAVPSAANGGYYAVIVSEVAVLRRLAEVGARIRQMGLETDASDVSLIVQSAFDELNKVPSEVRAEEDSMAETLERVLDNMENPKDELVYRSGLRALDELYRGGAAGRLDVIAARPGVGKSLLATCMAIETSVRNGIPSIFFSLEMSREEIVQRMIAALAKVNLHRIVDPQVYPPEPGDWAKIAKVTDIISRAPIEIVDRPVGLGDVNRRVRKGVKRGVRQVFVDYLQLMLFPRGVQDRQVAVGMNVDGLKHTSREFGVSMVCLSQLNRNPTTRGDGMPRLSDLRDSGSIEQSADCVIMIHRPDMEDSESPRAGEADLILPKQRNGRTGVATLVFQGHYARFADFAPEPS